MAGDDTSMTDAFRIADDVLLNAVQGISDLITVHGIINLDFADVKAIMSGMGLAMMGTGFGEGEDRAIEAARRAISSPLLEGASVQGARGVIINVTGGPDLSLMEVSDASTIVQEAADEDANIIFGAVVDPTLKGRVKITVIATGFDAVSGSMLQLNPQGRGGVRLSEKWATRFDTYLGMAIAGFPNLFMIHGPQSPGVLYTMPLGGERHMAWIDGCIRYLDENDLGAVEAVFLMGTAYDEGLGVAADPTIAAAWFHRAADAGHVLAQHNLGNAYADGRGVARMDVMAVYWWRKAAEAGDAIPQFRLARMYEEGLGVTRDLTVAVEWYRRAAERGHVPAAEALKRLDQYSR